MDLLMEKKNPGISKVMISINVGVFYMIQEWTLSIGLRFE